MLSSDGDAQDTVFQAVADMLDDGSSHVHAFTTATGDGRFPLNVLPLTIYKK